MIVAFILLGLILLVVGMFIPPPGRNIANLCGALLLVVGVGLALLSLLGYPVMVAR